MDGFFRGADIFDPDFKIPKVQNLCKPDGSCSGCSSCCHGMTLPITEEEAERMADYAAKKKYLPAPLEYMPGPWAQPGRKARCPFLDKGRCVVYPVRPKICRDFLCCMDEDKMKSLRNKRIAACEGEAELWPTFYPDENPMR